MGQRMYLSQDLTTLIMHSCLFIETFSTGCLLGNDNCHSMVAVRFSRGVSALQTLSIQLGPKHRGWSLWRRGSCLPHCWNYEPLYRCHRVMPPDPHAFGATSSPTKQDSSFGGLRSWILVNMLPISSISSIPLIATLHTQCLHHIVSPNCRRYSLARH